MVAPSAQPLKIKVLPVRSFPAAQSSALGPLQFVVTLVVTCLRQCRKKFVVSQTASSEWEWERERRGLGRSWGSGDNKQCLRQYRGLFLRAPYLLTAAFSTTSGALHRYFLTAALQSHVASFKMTPPYVSPGPLNGALCSKQKNLLAWSSAVLPSSLILLLVLSMENLYLLSLLLVTFALALLFHPPLKNQCLLIKVYWDFG